MKIQGTIKHVTFHNPQNGFTVLRIADEKTKKSVVVTGNLPLLTVGEKVKFFGDWGNHPKFGKQFVCKNFELMLSADGGDVVAFLSSGICAGVGPKVAQNIYDVFGDDTVDILDNYPEEFLDAKIKGLSKTKAVQFLESWQEARFSRETMMFLYSHDIVGSAAKKIWAKFGQESIAKIRENPYILCSEVYGIGFLKADEIAMKVGIPKDSPMRLQEALLYTLQEASISEGHTYLPKDNLIGRTLKNLRIDSGDEDSVHLLLELFEESCLAGRILRVEDDCFYPALYRAEEKIARDLLCRIHDQDQFISPEYINRELVDWERQHKFAFDPIQREAISQALSHKVFIITGGPGTGKTTILKGILHLARKLGENILLAAPTGRAAKRMGECCGEKASTLHRLLEVDPVSRKFAKNGENQLQCELLIVDEFSMVDTWLCAALLEAVSENTRIVLVGDADQLPSVGPGNVLNDLLSCPAIPSVRLQHIFRQAGDNDIAAKSALINQGVVPSPLEGPNFHFIPFETPEECKSYLQELISTGIRSKLDINLIEQMQVLVPMRRGPLGIFELNPFLQYIMNPRDYRCKMQGVEWSDGDRVMQVKNNYEKNVFNGDVGIVLYADASSKTLSVSFDDRTVEYVGDELDELTLAYACTIHKSQGSEYPAVVVVLDSSHFIMLQRNLIYTAITRAKGHVWVLSAPGAFHQAVHNNRSNKRYTRLAERIAKDS